MPHSSVPYAITDIGNCMVLGAIALSAIGYFLALRCHREAAAVAASFVLATVTIGILKLVFLSCGHDFLHIHSPSGHTALSVAVFGIFALLLARVPTGRRRFLLPSLLIMLAIAISITRVMLGFHTFSEVVVGMAAGLGSAASAGWIFLRRAPDVRPDAGGEPRFHVAIFLALTLTAALLTYGIRLPVETALGRIAGHIQASIPACQ